MTSDKKLTFWFPCFCLSIVGALSLGLLVVWLNIEQVDMAYKLKKLQTEISAAGNLSAKLEVERDNLVSPYRLSRRAEEMGMHPATSGQQRKIGLTD